jgi:hypothetical protein
MVITVSRADWGGAPVPSPVRILLGTLTVDANHQPQLGKVRFEKDDTIDRLQTKTYTIPTRGRRFAARVIIVNKFVPHDLDPSVGDVRQLGAVVTYRFVPGPAPQAAHK